ncbi:(2Fe-2S)-binding protein [Salinadaptatus halalkaliphilus]|uniref:(2Fe-2S)-binding protein n=1 Tax=Salinadaptatus halalkaliphilus TaxID=2419781 RepID=A0A4S3TJZ8_9EURY|nr:Rieske 2Fe-2S domain-containing protein [Salinadaptatus halalkaliphilus]THE64326.1 (2Fe-2S)-binding protein [Salinadaptatus halalkaliphilus]
MNSDRSIATVSDVPAESTLLFRIEDDDGEAHEAVLVDTDDGVACWQNYCQHFTHIALDKGSGAAMRDGEIVCENHGAYFEADSGICTYGPCEGATLAPLEVTVEDGEIYLTDPDFEYLGPGPIDDDDDMTSTSNVKI